MAPCPIFLQEVVNMGFATFALMRAKAKRAEPKKEEPKKAEEPKKEEPKPAEPAKEAKVEEPKVENKAEVKSEPKGKGKNLRDE